MLITVLFRLADLMERDIKLIGALERHVCPWFGADHQSQLGQGCSDRNVCYTYPRALSCLLTHSGGDVADSIGCLRYYAGLADKTHGQTIDHFGKDKFVYTLNQPIGVCGQM